ncbi:MAG: hypothetical protein N2315_08835 [Thermanaerothrix sp.]|nr:hypothetical protein [Thermanaerothrix sp.]
MSEYSIYAGKWLRKESIAAGETLTIAPEIVGDDRVLWLSCGIEAKSDAEFLIESLSFNLANGDVLLWVLNGFSRIVVNRGLVKIWLSELRDPAFLQNLIQSKPKEEGLIGRHVFTASGVLTLSQFTKGIYFIGQGGGGGGVSVSPGAPSGTTICIAGEPGNNGNVGEGFFPKDVLAGKVNVTIGAGGIGGAGSSFSISTSSTGYKGGDGGDTKIHTAVIRGGKGGDAAIFVTSTASSESTTSSFSSDPYTDDQNLLIVKRTNKRLRITVRADHTIGNGDAHDVAALPDRPRSRITGSITSSTPAHGQSSPYLGHGGGGAVAVHKAGSSSNLGVGGNGRDGWMIIEEWG